MEKNDKAIAVAQDVLDHLEVLDLREGTHFRVRDGHRLRTLEDTDCTDLRSCVNIVQHQCTVCLKGAAVLSKARLFDAVPMVLFLNQFSGCYPSQIKKVLLDVFDEDTLDLMEIAFEKYVPWYIQHYFSAIDAIQFGCRYEDPKERVRAVMENVIANGGKFVP